MLPVTRHIILIAVTLLAAAAKGQFAPAAGVQGSTAIHKDDQSFTAWATGCVLQRGYQDIADPSLGFATVGDETSPTGKAGTNGVVSLGDAGVATLTFASPVYNGPGFDFAVFENGFPTGEEGMAFLEFAFVEVSSDGVTFIRFDAVSHIPDTAQLAMVGMDCSQVNNLAGKYINGYGTPFDLEELKDKPGLDVNSITQVRIIDAVGSINPLYATYDSEGHKVNDPYPTAFASGGFDLDAVGVINSLGPNAINEAKVLAGIQVFPNPVAMGAQVTLNTTNHLGEPLVITDAYGRIVRELLVTDSRTNISTEGLLQGVYFLTLPNTTGKFIVQ
jgi:hypothetical protein